eukprot:TRINITY_DN55812_c0_g1_i1.p1 TRINITY_DN55812_c0_g1~~TRINITY_DN55812_c0_g1_i1.p1  ORF type:complete len:360 (-),score=57.52 TRINITY_DN55812_c0_g1_i1:97-1176(-)
MFRRAQQMMQPLKDSSERWPAWYKEQRSPYIRLKTLPLTVRTYYPWCASIANRVTRWRTPLWKYRPVKWLTRYYAPSAGRNHTGHIVVRGRQGGAKCNRVVVNYQYPHPEMPKRVLTYEYNRRRSAWLSLVYYDNGVLAYHPLVDGLEKGAIAYQQGSGLVPQTGEWRQVKDVPPGTLVCNVEIWPNRGGGIARAAGTSCMVMRSSEEQHRLHLVPLVLPSRAVRLVSEDCWCTVGMVSNPEHKYEQLGKAGRARNLGHRPKVRGIAMNAVDHPHGSKNARKSGKGKKGAARSIYGWITKCGFRHRPEYKPQYKYTIREARQVRHARYQGKIETARPVQSPEVLASFRRKFEQELRLLD